MGASLNLHHAVQRRGGRETLRVDHLAVEAGEHVSVLGPNGAGKTTLLRLIAGVDAPASGSVTIDGSSLTSGGVETRRRIAYASQQPGLLSTSVRRNVELPLAWRKVPRHVRTALAMESLERLRVAHLADRAARALSGGEQQRVNLARALALEPAVLLLDEPAAGLDAPSRAAFFADLDRALADRAITVIQVSHRAEEAMPFADRVVVLHEGRVHQVGTPDALSLRPADATVATLVGYDNLIDATALPDGTVTVDGHRTGLDQAGASGPATIAAFAPGVHAADANSPGIPARVVRVASGPGHRIVTLDGPASVIAHLPLGQPAPMVGDDVRLTFDPASCVVIDTAAPATNREGTSDEHHGRMAHHRQA